MSTITKLGSLLLATALAVGCDSEPTTPSAEGNALVPSIGDVRLGSTEFPEEVVVATPANAAPQFNLVAPALFAPTVFNTDFVAVGVGAMRNQPGPHTITLSGVSGPVSQALLYWNGPTNSTNPGANASVFVNGNAVTGTNIGFSDDNCWGFLNSQSYVADVTPLVPGDGNYVLTGFGFGSVNTNGASLVVFSNDGTAANNRDVVIFEGNDSNINNPFDPPGWTVTLGGIMYTGGTAGMQLHIADGQNFFDDALLINGNVKIPISNWATGFSVPGVNNGPQADGRLWDILNFDVTADLTAAGLPPQTLQLTTGVYNDCLGLVVAVVDLPAGAAPGNVDIDIKPGSDPNSINLGAKDVIPVAVLTTAAFDAADVDPATVTLGNDDGNDTPVAVKKNGSLFASLEDVDWDGDLDLSLKFNQPALEANGDLDTSTTELILNGATFGGQLIYGSDAVRLTPASF